MVRRINLFDCDLIGDLCVNSVGIRYPEFIHICGLFAFCSLMLVYGCDFFGWCLDAIVWGLLCLLCFVCL